MADEETSGPAESRLPAGIAEALRNHHIEDVLATVLMRLRRVEHAVVAMRELVPEAFKEGFAKRLPDSAEPWLADWLTSDTKAALEHIVERPHHHEHHE